MSDENSLGIYNHFLSNFLPVFRNISLLSRYIGNSDLQNHPNPLAKFGAKVYSQNDEDGITFEILRRIGIAENAVFAEFGVGDGTENNTLALAACGWSGFWVGNQDLAFNHNPAGVAECRFSYRKEWVTKPNIAGLYFDSLASIGKTDCQLVSLDLDGNDYYLVDELLSSGASPEVFIVEYNSKFIPPIKFVIEYDDQHNWVGDDYFGASFSAFVELFAGHGYFPVCCNVTGSNAFFVKNKYKDLFSDVPQEIELIYASPKYFLTGLDVSGHPASTKAIELIFRKLNSSGHEE
jgi:hypothetical protein